MAKYVGGGSSCKAFENDGARWLRAPASLVARLAVNQACFAGGGGLSRRDGARSTIGLEWCFTCTTPAGWSHGSPSIWMCRGSESSILSSSTFREYVSRGVKKCPYEKGEQVGRTEQSVYCTTK